MTDETTSLILEWMRRLDNRFTDLQGEVQRRTDGQLAMIRHQLAMMTEYRC